MNGTKQSIAEILTNLKGSSDDNLDPAVGKYSQGYCQLNYLTIIVCTSFRGGAWCSSSLS